MEAPREEHFPPGATRKPEKVRLAPEPPPGPWQRGEETIEMPLAHDEPHTQKWERIKGEGNPPETYMG